MVREAVDIGRPSLGGLLQDAFPLVIFFDVLGQDGRTHQEHAALGLVVNLPQLFNALASGLVAVQRVVDLVDNEQVLRSQAVDNLGNLELGVAFDRQA